MLHKYWVRIIGIVLLVHFSVSTLGQKSSQFDKTYQKALDYHVYYKDSSKQLYNELQNKYTHPTPLQKAKLQYLFFKLNGNKTVVGTNDVAFEKIIPEKHITDTLKTANTYLKLGESYIKNNESTKGIQFLYKAIALYDTLHLNTKKHQCSLLIAEEYRVQNQYENGITIIYELLQDKHISIKDKAYSYNRLAALYHEYKNDDMLNKSDSVLKYSNKSLKISEENNFIEYQALSQNELGFLYKRKLKDLVKSEKYFNRALHNFKQVESYQNVINTTINLSNVYILQNKPKEALRICNKAFEYPLGEQASMITMRLFLQMSNVHKMNANYYEAYEFLSLGRLLERMIYHNRIDSKLMELAAKHESDIKNKQLLYEKEKNKLLTSRQKLLLISGLLLLVTFIIILYSFNIKRKLTIQKNLLTKKENIKLNYQLENSQKRLVSNTMQLVNQSEFQHKIIPVLEDLENESSGVNKKKLTRIIQKIKLNNNQMNWLEFNKSFNEVYTSFYKNLQLSHPVLKSQDLKLCAFIKLNMNTKDIAAIINISPRGVETARYRLRKKLELTHDDNLTHYLQNF